jgi:hypothetical protein
MNVAICLSGGPHARGQASLYWVRRRSRRLFASRGAHIIRCDAAACAPAEHTAYDCVFRGGASKRFGPCRVDLRLRAAQKTRSDLRRTCSEGEGSGNPASVGNPAGGHHRDIHGIHDRRQQRKEPDLLALGPCRLETAAMAPGFRALSDDYVGSRCCGRPGLGDRRNGSGPGNPRLLEPRNIFR